MNALTVTDTRELSTTKYNWMVHGAINGERVQLGFDFKHIASQWVQIKLDATTTGKRR